VAPVTYAWTQVVFGSFTWTITSPTAASTTFTCQSLPAGQFDEARFQVMATDATGATGTKTVDASANNGIPYDPTDHCVTDDSLILMADGSEKPFRDCKAGDLIETFDEFTLKRVVARIVVLDFAEADVFKLSAFPRASRDHRYSLPRLIARLLPERLRWWRIGWFGRPAGKAIVGKATTTVGTYLARLPVPGSKWRLCHNLKRLP
jgi:hypothetical protein